MRENGYFLRIYDFPEYFFLTLHLSHFSIFIALPLSFYNVVATLVKNVFRKFWPTASTSYEDILKCVRQQQTSQRPFLTVAVSLYYSVTVGTKNLKFWEYVSFRVAFRWCKRQVSKISSFCLNIKKPMYQDLWTTLYGWQTHSLELHIESV